VNRKERHQWTLSVDCFFRMVREPVLGDRYDLKYHDELEIGKNVKVYVPFAVTELLKITVLDKIKGHTELKKCAPYIVLPECYKRMSSAMDSSNEYKNVMMLLILQINGHNFSLPIEGFLGQKPTAKERKREVFSHNSESGLVIFFPAARMPGAFIKHELDKWNVCHLTVVFIVDNMVVRDNNRRETEINTNNSRGISLTRGKQEEAYRFQYS